MASNAGTIRWSLVDRSASKRIRVWSYKLENKEGTLTKFLKVTCQPYIWLQSIWRIRASLMVRLGDDLDGSIVEAQQDWFVNGSYITRQDIHAKAKEWVQEKFESPMDQIFNKLRG